MLDKSSYLTIDSSNLVRLTRFNGSTYIFAIIFLICFLAYCYIVLSSKGKRIDNDVSIERRSFNMQDPECEKLINEGIRMIRRNVMKYNNLLLAVKEEIDKSYYNFDDTIFLSKKDNTMIYIDKFNFLKQPQIFVVQLSDLISSEVIIEKTESKAQKIMDSRFMMFMKEKKEAFIDLLCKTKFFRRNENYIGENVISVKVRIRTSDSKLPFADYYFYKNGFINIYIEDKNPIKEAEKLNRKLENYIDGNNQVKCKNSL